jgi:hypothetical protein
MKTGLHLLLFVLTFQLHGQIKCDRNKITGEWNEVTNMPGVHTNVDSLKQLIKYKSESIGVWDFKLNNTYTYKDSHSGKYYRNGEGYNFDNGTCEIILWEKTKSRTERKSKRNLEVIYVDNNFMIYKSDDNPKGYYTHLMTRR